MERFPPSANAVDHHGGQITPAFEGNKKNWARALSEKRLNSTTIRGEASDPRAGGAAGRGSALLQRPGSTDRLVFKSLSLIFYFFFFTLKLKKGKQMKPLKHLDGEKASALFGISGKKQKKTEEKVYFPSDFSFDNKI